MWKCIFGAAAFTSLAISPVCAQTVPNIIGKYAINYQEICQANNPSNPTQGVGETYTQIVVADFAKAAGTVKITGTSVMGPLTGPYSPLSETTLSSKVAYSNTASTITIDRTTYNVVYGLIDAREDAMSFVFGGISNNGCAVSATALLQSIPN